AEQIDTSEPFSLVGVSFGGMLSVEIAKHFPPERIVILSSAKCAQELPLTYRIFRNFPIHRIFSGQFFRWWGIRLQPLFEPIPKEDRSFFRSMLKEKRPIYMKRTLNYILTWEKEQCDTEIIHVHGAKDRTIPYKNVSPTLTLPTAGHMMVYTHAKEVSQLLETYLP
ncbi:MAG: alpha/beta hydrolase, partial [Bacteroidota bacterium]